MDQNMDQSSGDDDHDDVIVCLLGARKGKTPTKRKVRIVPRTSSSSAVAYAVHGSDDDELVADVDETEDETEERQEIWPIGSRLGSTIDNLIKGFNSLRRSVVKNNLPSVAVRTDSHLRDGISANGWSCMKQTLWVIMSTVAKILAPAMLMSSLEGHVPWAA
eukprot:IDg23740t1